MPLPLPLPFALPVLMCRRTVGDATATPCLTPPLGCAPIAQRSLPLTLAPPPRACDFDLLAGADSEEDEDAREAEDEEDDCRLTEVERAALAVGASRRSCTASTLVSNSCAIAAIGSRYAPPPEPSSGR